MNQSLVVGLRHGMGSHLRSVRPPRHALFRRRLHAARFGPPEAHPPSHPCDARLCVAGCRKVLTLAAPGTGLAERFRSDCGRECRSTTAVERKTCSSAVRLGALGRIAFDPRCNPRDRRRSSVEYGRCVCCFGSTEAEVRVQSSGRRLATWTPRRSRRYGNVRHGLVAMVLGTVVFATGQTTVAFGWAGADGQLGAPLKVRGETLADVVRSDIARIASAVVAGELPRRGVAGTEPAQGAIVSRPHLSRVRPGLRVGRVQPTLGSRGSSSRRKRSGIAGAIVGSAIGICFVYVLCEGHQCAPKKKAYPISVGVLGLAGYGIGYFIGGL